jgi:hypothetical protein
MKALNWIAWISLGIGLVITLIGVTSIIPATNIFGVHHSINVFLVANSFFLLTIALFVSKKE